MKTELKGLNGKVAIHCTTPEEIKAAGQLLVDSGLMDRLHVDYAIEEMEESGEPMAYCEYDGWRHGSLKFAKTNGYTIISASEFIAMNTEPEAAPAWSFKTDEELKNFVATFLATKGDFEKFLSSLRKPAFELIMMAL